MLNGLYIYIQKLLYIYNYIYIQKWNIYIYRNYIFMYLIDKQYI